MGRLDKLRRKLLTVPAEMSFADVEHVLIGAGYGLDRTDGSHHQFTKAGADTLTVTNHSGKVPRYQLRQIARQIRQPGE